MNLDFKNLLASLKSFGKSTPSGKTVGIALYRDWMILVVTLLTVTVVALGFGIYLFYSVVNASLSNSTVQSPADTLSRQKLEDVINAFTKKEATYSARKAIKPDLPNL